MRRSSAPYRHLLRRWAEPTRRFVIVCPPRTGSELLVGLLDAHPAIVCSSEILHVPVVAPDLYLRGYGRWKSSGRTEAWGFKLIDTHLRWQLSREGDRGEFLGLLVDEGYTVIYLTRSDLLAQALSWAHAARSGYHHEVDAATGFEPMRVDPAELLHYLHALDDNSRWLAEVVEGLPHVRLRYEHDLSTPAQIATTVQRLQAELGVPLQPVEPRLAKVAPDSPRERASNYDEIVATLRTTRFRHLLD